MTKRKWIGLSVGVSFVVLLITGLLSYLQPYTRTTATIHTIFGIVFSIGAILHIRNNFKVLKLYSKGKVLWVVLCVGLAISFGSYFQVMPFGYIMDIGTQSKAKSKQTVDPSKYEIVDMDLSKDIKLTLDVLKGEHYWHPQMAVWVENENGDYLSTLFVSKATAKGLFFGGRNKTNFKTFDEAKSTSASYRRVNALPVWSHSRNVKYEDGMLIPTRSTPLPDAITGETITDSFMLNSSLEVYSRFVIKVEINVAFDDNEYYSEYDFPDDEVFHNGTGQLGQPSIVFEAIVDMEDDQPYYLMDLIGHGHHSAQNGMIYKDLSKLTTAKAIIERIVVKVATDD